VLIDTGTVDLEVLVPDVTLNVLATRISLTVQVADVDLIQV
jgi:hypothetical protein